jgi:DNA helicase II / ATP-dependent DNA helicase PcrA
MSIGTDEQLRLQQVRIKLGEALARLESRVKAYAAEAREQYTHMFEHSRDMDHIEKADAREAAQRTLTTGDVIAAARKRVQKLLGSPYFGRIDFQKAGERASTPVYVGVHAFADPDGGAPLVFDWRAPISTMFYDYELGEARYRSPQGIVAGDIRLKRQYRIRNGRMELMLESGVSILDDVLQEELSRTSDERMKTIVATIQRDQNAIIRNEDAQVLVIQGVAGSGKTSIALHRIAFLLYRFKDTLASRDILIISPNKVFADFISNVLPELGEEQIAEVEMEKLAHELLEHKVTFQRLFDQTAALVDGRDDNLRRRIETKATFEFLEQLDAYVAHVEASRFKPRDVQLGGHVIRARFIEQAYQKRPDLRGGERLAWVADSMVQHVRVTHRRELSTKERTELRAAIKKMSTSTNLRAAYKQFYEWIGKPDLLQSAGRSTLEYSDVFPLIYLKLRLDGIESVHRQVKHLVIDEMQDYTPVQYAVISRLFACDKTILGDASQAVHGSRASTAEMIARVFKQAECVKLCKSYRSSYEITQFAQGISADADLVAIERHGEQPVVVSVVNEADERQQIVEMIAAMADRGYRTTGIICKTQPRAERLHEALTSAGHVAHLLTATSTAFVQGTVVCTVHLAKGLEFDQVVVPSATDDHYASDLDRNLLYVACTRAMHRLLLTHVGPPTRFLPDAARYERRRAG